MLLKMKEFGTKEHIWSLVVPWLPGTLEMMELGVHLRSALHLWESPRIDVLKHVVPGQCRPCTACTVHMVGTAPALTLLYLRLLRILQWALPPEDPLVLPKSRKREADWIGQGPEYPTSRSSGRFLRGIWKEGPPEMCSFYFWLELWTETLLMSCLGTHVNM